jgi:hypothetical protein
VGAQADLSASTDVFPFYGRLVAVLDGLHPASGASGSGGVGPSVGEALVALLLDDLRALLRRLQRSSGRITGDAVSPLEARAVRHTRFLSELVKYGAGLHADMPGAPALCEPKLLFAVMQTCLRAFTPETLTVLAAALEVSAG